MRGRKCLKQFLCFIFNFYDFCSYLDNWWNSHKRVYSQSLFIFLELGTRLFALLFRATFLLFYSFSNCFTMCDSTQEASDSLRYTTPPNNPGELTGNSTTTLPDTTLADTPRTDRIDKTYASFDTEDDATNERQDEIFAEQYIALATKHAQENAALYANATPRQRAIMDGAPRNVPLDLASSSPDSRLRSR